MSWLLVTFTPKYRMSYVISKMGFLFLARARFSRTIGSFVHHNHCVVVVHGLLPSIMKTTFTWYTSMWTFTHFEHVVYLTPFLSNWGICWSSTLPITVLITSNEIIFIFHAMQTCDLKHGRAIFVSTWAGYGINCDWCSRLSIYHK